MAKDSLSILDKAENYCQIHGFLQRRKCMYLHNGREGYCNKLPRIFIMVKLIKLIYIREER